MPGPIYPDQTGALARWIDSGQSTREDTAAAPAEEPTGYDWSSGRDHWNRDRRPCRHCRQPTNLRDSTGNPAHKICAQNTGTP